jgi:mercuric ion binding protein
MKTIKVILTSVFVMVFIAGFTVQIAGQSDSATSKTESVKVLGNCDMCKARIEKAAKIDGVIKAEWNKDSKMLTLVYNPGKVTSEAVQKRIAAVGHDTEKFKADDKVYSNLPGCCKYR